MLNSIGKILSLGLLDNPVFVVGGGRSGTSVLVQALGKHKSIYSFKGEDPFICHLIHVVHVMEFSEARSINYYKESLHISYQYIFKRLKELIYESAFGKNHGLKQMTKDMILGMFNPLTKKYWCAKTFPQADIAAALQRLYPSAKFIYIHRNGIDVVHSRTQFPGFKDLDFRKQCEEWSQSVKKYHYLTSHPLAVTVRHEDLVENPSAVFDTIFKKLGFEPDSRPANFTSTHQIHPLSSTTNSDNISVKAEMSSRTVPYQTWSLEKKEIFKEVCADSMRLLDYEIPF